MPTLILVRGLPGSGKSTLAKKLCSEADTHVETDMFWGPEYAFDHSKLKDAHEWCLNAAQLAMEKEKGDVIVSNTFTQAWEAQKYVESAKAHGYQIQVVEVKGPWENTHNVPEAVMVKMANRFQTTDMFCRELEI